MKTLKTSPRLDSSLELKGGRELGGHFHAKVLPRRVDALNRPPRRWKWYKFPTRRARRIETRWKKKKKRINSEEGGERFIEGIILKNNIGQRVSRNKTLSSEHFIIYHGIFRLNGTRVGLVERNHHLTHVYICRVIYIFSVIPEQENGFSIVI